MSGVPDYTLEDTLDFKFTTRRFSTGAPFAFDSGVIEIYEDNSVTQITGAETLSLEFDGVTGLHNLRVAATAANGFEIGKSYQCVVSVGTVDSVSVVGEVVQQFSIGRASGSADKVWDEVLTGGTHNVNNSAGRRLRQLQESGGYELGRIWIDTNNGTAGTTAFENGTAVNPVDSIEDAKTLSADSTVNLSDFHVINGSSITLAESTTNESYFGNNWTLVLNNQATGGAHFEGADVSGTQTGSGMGLHGGELSTCSLADDAHMDEVGLSGTITLAAGSIEFFNCHHDGSGLPILDFATGNTTVHMHNYHGGFEVQNMDSSDIIHIDGDGRLDINANCTSAVINIRGAWDINDSGTTTAITKDDTTVDVEAVKVVTDKFDAADSEPTGVPAANETPLVKLAYTFMALRNKLLVSATKKQFFDDGGAVEWEKDLADDGTDYTESEANAP